MTEIATGEREAFEDRARRYLEAVLSADEALAADPSDGIFQLVPSAVFRLIPPLALDRGPLDPTPLLAALDLIAARRDCADFALAGILRILRLYASSERLAPELRGAMEDAARRFCYWYDEPGIRGMCFHTENHQILFHSCEVLAGQMFPEHVFENSGRTGRWHAEQGTARALRWIDERARFGFVEWLSCYYEEDLLALLNLCDFADDPALRRRAGMLVDMLLFEVALQAHKGILGTTHGRTYAEYIKGGRLDPISAISWLVFGEGVFTDRPNLALTALSTSGYRCPPLIRAIAADRPAERLCRERCGLDVAEAAGWGLRADRLEDQMFFWACQTARHPLARAAARQLAQAASDPWLEGFIESVDLPLAATRAVVESGGAEFDGDAVNTALAAADLISFRTPDYVLSCAQDFRPGRPGYQQHVWQATLDAEAVVFTNHPGTANESSAHMERPNFWAGNRFLPRAAQWRNVLICLHHVAADDPFAFSHAYFPRRAFDEALVLENWTFARKNGGYLALYSHTPARWVTEGGSGIELRAASPDNVWICEMGTAQGWGTFERFVAAVAAAPVVIDGLNVRWISPSLGELRFGWIGPLMVDGVEIALHGYPRYDNPYCQAAAGDRHYVIERDGEQVVWDFAANG
jgi:hypothetical protein